MSGRGRKLEWFGGQGLARYDGADVELKSKPRIAGVREFVEILYQPSAHKALLRLPHRRARVDMSHAEREACDTLLDAMARAARGVFG